MTTPRLRAKAARKKGAFLAAFMAAEEPLAKASTAAVREAADRIKLAGRASIAAAGFGRKWQDTLRADVYPEGETTSINAAVHVYHRIHYATAFEEGATITGRPWLWIPLPTAPQRIGRMRATPRRYTDLVGPLQYVRRPGRPPLLVARVAMGRGARPKRVSISALRRGATGQGKNKVVRSIPLFVGIRTIQIRRRFNITGVVEQTGARLAALYLKHLKDA